MANARKKDISPFFIPPMLWVFYPFPQQHLRERADQPTLPTFACPKGFACGRGLKKGNILPSLWKFMKPPFFFSFLSLPGKCQRKTEISPCSILAMKCNVFSEGRRINFPHLLLDLSLSLSFSLNLPEKSHEYKLIRHAVKWRTNEIFASIHSAPLRSVGVILADL